MTNKYIINEQIYPIGWRFNADDCSMPESDKKNLVFLNEHDSFLLWKLNFIFDNDTEINLSKDGRYIEILEKSEALFFCNEKFLFFADVVKEKFCIFFAGKYCAIMTSAELFLKYWDDFFYPSDENCILLLPAQDKIIFSFNETFFLANLKY